MLIGVLVAFAIGYTFAFQNPLFLADVSSVFHTGSPGLQVTPYLPSSSSAQWNTQGFAYSCGGSGPGILEVKNGGSQGATVVSMSLTYGGQNYTTTGPSCTAGPGNTLISITALGGPAGAQGSSFTGYAEAPDGTEFHFSGTWQ